MALVSQAPWAEKPPFAHVSCVRRVLWSLFVSCAQVVSQGYSYVSNEYTLQGGLHDMYDTHFCPQFVNVVTMRWVGGRGPGRGPAGGAVRRGRTWAGGSWAGVGARTDLRLALGWAGGGKRDPGSNRGCVTEPELGLVLAVLAATL